MKYNINIIARQIFILATFLTTGCSKYLEKKPDKKLVVPSTIADLQAVIDNNDFMNGYPWGLDESSADDYYLTKADWESRYSEYDKNVYIWSSEIIGSSFPNVWSDIYLSIYNTNVVLDNVDKVSGESEDKKNAAGIAYFFRAFAFFRLATTFTNSYDDATADTDLGIPLRLSSDFNIKSVRSTNKQTYTQIINDLTNAVSLLPTLSNHVIRPSKAAAYGLLARVYLSMRKYEKAGLYADSSLRLNSELLDFNTLDVNANYPISIFNKETLFFATGGGSDLNNSIAKVDSILYESYGENDLRKLIYFKANSDDSHGFHGSYTGTSHLFQGVASDEMYLIKAECYARSGKIQEAMTTLNDLLVTRWKAGTFTPFTASNKEAALAIIIKERRKELVMRDIRWQDIKRLNKEGAGINLKRILGDQVYELPANSPKFALPLPDYIIKLTGMQQNPR
jgi:tetratricopeptide (TPR) repeat protein